MKYQQQKFKHREIRELLEKDNGLLKFKFDEYGKQWLVKQMTEKTTKRQQAAWLALRDVLLLDAQGKPYDLIINQKRIEIRS